MLCTICCVILSRNGPKTIHVRRTLHNRLLSKKKIDAFEVDIFLDQTKIEKPFDDETKDPPDYQTEDPSTHRTKNHLDDPFQLDFSCQTTKEYFRINLKLGKRSSKSPRDDVKQFFVAFSRRWIGREKDVDWNEIKYDPYCIKLRSQIPLGLYEKTFRVEYRPTWTTNANSVYVLSTHSRAIMFKQSWVKDIMLGSKAIQPYVADAFDATVLDPLKVCRDYFSHSPGLDILILDCKPETKEENSQGEVRTFVYEHSEKSERVLVLMEMDCESFNDVDADPLYGLLGQCLVAQNKRTTMDKIQPITQTSVGEEKKSKAEIKYISTHKKETTTTMDNVFVTNHWYSMNVVFRQDWVKDLMVKMGAVRPCTPKLLFERCIKEVAHNDKRRAFQLTSRAWAVSRFDPIEETTRSAYSRLSKKSGGEPGDHEIIPESIISDKTIVEIFAQVLRSQRLESKHQYHALIQAMVFYGASICDTVGKHRFVLNTLNKYEKTFNLPSTKRCVHSYVSKAVKEVLYSDVANIVLELLGLPKKV